jgi:hypothetical protein
MIAIRAVRAAIAIVLVAACHDASLPIDPVGPPSSQPSSDPGNWGTGWIFREDTPVEVHFEIRNGRAMFEGDIDLGPVETIGQTREKLVGRRGSGARYGIVTEVGGRRWPGGSVPYVVEPDFPNPSLLYAAFDHIRSRTGGVDFHPRTNESDYIAFTRETDDRFCGHSDQVGRVGGRQIVAVSANSGCGLGVVVHEIGHALGVWHEQSRCDRDTYVQILWDNLIPGSDVQAQFNKYCSGTTDVNSYEEGSIMHYDRFAFSRQPGVLPTIRSLRGRDNLMGQRDSLATIDAYTIDWMYHPPSPPNFSLTYSPIGPTACSAFQQCAMVSWPPQPGALYYHVHYYIVTWPRDEFGTPTWSREDQDWGTTTDTTFTVPAPDTGDNQCGDGVYVGALYPNSTSNSGWVNTATCGGWSYPGGS